MNPSFLRRIEDPETAHRRELLADARDVARERLAEYGVREVDDDTLTRLAYTYYHDWERDDPSVVFLLEDPGTPGEHVVAEVAAISDVDATAAPLDLVAVYRRIFARWLMKREYAAFARRFVRTCAEFGIVSAGRPWWRYVLSGAFFDDFYATDVVKYRAGSSSAAAVAESVESVLVPELEAVAPELVLAFGNRAWDAVRDALDVVPGTDVAPGAGIRTVHGHLFRTAGPLEVPVLPLAHMSPQVVGAQVTLEEYAAGLERGLGAWTASR